MPPRKRRAKPQEALEDIAEEEEAQAYEPVQEAVDDPEAEIAAVIAECRKQSKLFQLNRCAVTVKAERLWPLHVHGLAMVCCSTLLAFGVQLRRRRKTCCSRRTYMHHTSATRAMWLSSSCQVR